VTTVWVTGDQVTPHNSALAGLDPRQTVILMVESIARSRQRRYHKRKLALIFSAMRGYADDRRRAGWTLDYRPECDDFESALAEHVRTYAPDRFRMMAQSDTASTRAWRRRSQSMDYSSK